MKTVLAKLLSLILICSFTTVAAAQTPASVAPSITPQAATPLNLVVPVLPAIPEGPDIHSFLKKGAVAPFDGFLFDSPTALRWGNWLNLWKVRYQIDLEAQQKVCTATTTMLQEQLKIEQQRNAYVLDTYKQQLELERKKNDQPWYRSFEFGVGVGVVGSLVLVIATGYALGRVK